MKLQLLLNSGIVGMSLFICGVKAATDLGPVGDIHFSITITTKACEMEKSDLEVDMGTMMLPKHAAVGTVLSKKDFTIELKECDGISKATVEMDSQPDTDDDSFFALESGGATGVALKIEDDKGTQQIPKATGGTPIEWAISGETTSLHYQASYIVVNSQPKGGTADALVNFSITYE
ncbi:long polar fimbrial protein LpfE [Escherichia sp. E2748]|uniref:long polar fimbrial protein LpfE n=1 Tax=Escherichia sp. E2748 TaxID=2044460 RepID=UPI0010805DD2|nr:long polar fimbrial protein LpfE [Escherichia sp. E2748]TGB90763.1 long polar fimbrial protein LpfE [Escherichia sp. E2748]TLI82524.1 long polar fimbrial protein LpfE [Escherichia sp. E2748]